MLVFIYVLYLFKLGSSDTSEELGLNKLVSHIMRTEMNSCSIAIIYDKNKTNLRLLKMIGKSSIYGVINVVVDESFHNDSMLLLKQTLLSRGHPLCISYIILSTSLIWKKVIGNVDTFAGVSKLVVISMTENRPSYKNSLLQHRNLRFSSKTIFIEKDDAKELWKIYCLVLFNGNYRQTYQFINEWNGEKFLKQNSLFSSNKFLNFEKFNFTVASIPYSPFVIENNLKMLGADKYRGFEINILDMLARGANFTYHYVRPIDNEWGRVDEAGKWTGMVGMVSREDADIAVSDISFSSARDKAVDFSAPFIYDTSELITPKALPLPLWLAPVRPFQNTVWILTAVSIVLSTITIFVISRVHHSESSFQHLFTCFSYCLQPLLMKGSTENYTNDVGRTYLGLWFFMAVLLSIAYSSSLTSFLVLPGFTKPIEDPEQLIHSDIIWAKVNFGGIQNELFKHTTDPVLVKLWKGIQWRTSMDEILSEIVEGITATWENSLTMRLKVALQYSDEAMVPLVYFTNYELTVDHISWPLIRNAPYKPRFDDLITRLVENGLVNKFLKDTIATEKKAYREKHKNVPLKRSQPLTNVGVVLTIEHLQGPFYLLVIGMFIALIIFILERIAHNFSQRNNTLPHKHKSRVNVQGSQLIIRKFSNYNKGKIDPAKFYK